MFKKSHREVARRLATEAICPDRLLRSLRSLAMTVVGLVVSLVYVSCAYAENAESQSSATITSDELEIRDNGAQTFFRGHVVLTEKPYLLLSDEMIRTKSTGIVDA